MDEIKIKKKPLNVWKKERVSIENEKDSKNLSEKKIHNKPRIK